MNTEDLGVAVENAAMKELQLKEDVEKFVEYAHKFMALEEFKRICILCEKTVPRGGIIVNLRDEKSLLINPDIVFIGHLNLETSFCFLKEADKVKAVSLDKIARRWFEITELFLSREDAILRFWTELSSSVDKFAYWFRRKHDDDFDKSEIAKANAEYAERQKVYAKKSWRTFFKWLAFAAIFVSVVFVLVIPK